MGHGIETGEELKKGVVGVFRILDSWKLSASEVRGILGFPFGTQLAEWRAGDLSSMPLDVVSRLRHIGSIYRLLLGAPLDGGAWLRRPVTQFGNQTSLERMASGDIIDLIAVHDYLKAHYGTGGLRAYRVARGRR